jgi:DUF971 family protein
MQPTHFDLQQDGAVLRVEWLESPTDEIPAGRLREAARDAVSIRQCIDHGGVAVAPDLRILGYQVIGMMGLNVHFSDGHDRAIYPWRYLRELARGDVN